MGTIEFVLLAIGAILVIATYILSEKFESDGKDIENELGKHTREIAAELAREEVNREIAENIDEKIEEFAVEVDKITNEKIMALGSYSDDVFKRIDNNHQEVMFLYNMLNDKEEKLKDTMRDIEALKQSIKKMAVVGSMSGANATPEKRKVEPEAPKKVEIENKPTMSEAEMDNVLNSNKAQLESVSEPELIVEPGIEAKGNKNEEILKLYQQGKTNMEIAKTLGIGMGEVKLVIDLFKK